VPEEETTDGQLAIAPEPKHDQTSASFSGEKVTTLLIWGSALDLDQIQWDTGSYLKPRRNGTSTPDHPREQGADPL
jgi:hypothetical protein